MLEIGFEAHSDDLNGYMPIHFYFRVAQYFNMMSQVPTALCFSLISALEPFLDPFNGVKNYSKNSIFDLIYLVKNCTFLITSKIFTPPLEVCSEYF